jgi:ubiquinone/menaquinone biosynthesis C-methylase UbiE
MAAPSVHPVYPWEVAPTPRPAPAVDPDPDPSEAERLAERDVWRVYPTPKPAGGPHAPLTSDWFKHLDSKRYRHHGRWLPALLEFSRHARESLMAVGDGLGIDWVRFAEGGADVTVVDPSADRLRLYRTHFASRGATGQFVQAPFDHLPSADSRVDVVCAVFHEPPVVPWANALAEAYRVLRPGGKVMVVLPAKFDAVWWQDLFLPWRRWLRKTPRRKGRFTARELREAFARFHDVRVLKRHLRRSELPYLWRWMLLPALERVMGRFLVVKAFKPLIEESAATARAAA